ncbi:MAG: arylsulfatase [Planctomycetes bacterium]|nr:arylsulfatase [Planctomycetota bacterium]
MIASLVVLISIFCPATSDAKPNIIVILVDDMGFSDLGCYGSEIPTPNLDALAASGLQFTQFYNTGRCCPTRASLLTGLYSHQTGIGWMTADQGSPGYRGQLNDRCVTFAEVLNTAGYFTAMTGKWHVGFEHGVTPWSRGFQRSLNLPAGGVYLPGSPRCDLHLNGEAIPPDDPRLPKNWYGTDLWTEFGIRFIDEALDANKPFFLYLAHVAPHFPLQADEEDIARFRGRYKQGWDVLSRQRLERQRASGLIDPEWQPEPRPEQIAAWDSLTPEQQDRIDHIMAVYAAVVSRMDRSIGTLVSALRERGVLDNTLILFMSDNGGNAESGPGGKTEGDPTTATSWWYCGQSWAHLENTPFRKYKHYNHEGGIASPLIVHWPEVIATNGPDAVKQSRLVRTPAHIIDIMATCVDVAGAEYPKEFNGKPIQPLEGQSLRPLFSLSSRLPDSLSQRRLYWEHEGNAAIRAGDRKLVRQGIKGPWELFDLAADRTEQHNLASQRPDEVRELAEQWERWAERANVLPKPARKPAKKQNRKRKASNAQE